MQRRVLMVVGNPCTHDARVLKEAQTLRDAGYAVTVLCDSDHGRLADQNIDGLRLRRVDMSIRASLPHALVRALTGRKAGPRSTSTSTPLEDARAAPPPTMLDGVHLPITLLRYRALRRAALRALADERFDIVHGHDLECMPAAMALARRWRAALVYDAHEFERGRIGASAVHNRFTAALEGYVLRRARAVITVCDSIATHLAAAPGAPRPCVILNAPAAPAALPAPGTQGLRAATGLAASIPLAVYIGRAAPARGIEQLLKALPLWPALHLACVGPVEPRYAARLTALATDLSVAARLHMLPSVPPATVIDYVASADFAVAPTLDVCASYRYSLPNKLFEASFAGLPVCASDLPEQRRLLNEVGNGVLVDPTDTPALAAALRDTYVQRATLRLDASRFAALGKRYAWEVQARRLVELYASL